MNRCTMSAVDQNACDSLSGVHLLAAYAYAQALWKWHSSMVFNQFCTMPYKSVRGLVWAERCTFAFSFFYCADYSWRESLRSLNKGHWRAFTCQRWWFKHHEITSIKSERRNVENNFDRPKMQCRGENNHVKNRFMAHKINSLFT